MGLPVSTLCIATYNWPDALQLCLDSVLRQSRLPDEIIIADDGSTPSTREVIEGFRKVCPVPLVHVWQPDEGFRLAMIRNKAFAAAKGEYILQVDGDLILHPRFVEDHLKFARAGTFMSGSRAMLDPVWSQECIHSGAFRPPGLFSRHLTKKYNAFRQPVLAAVNHQLQRGRREYRYVLGCNMSFWKADLLRVNGYNEQFSGWGKEDNDIAVRLMNAGVRLRFIKFAGVVYHLYHRESEKQQLQVNEELFEHSIRKKVTYISQGMARYQ